MGKYEPIKGAEDCDNHTAILINPDSMTLLSLSSKHSHEDLEMSLRDSHPRSPLPLPLPLHNANPLPSASSSKFDSSPDQRHRLVSLDVFRGITVAVIIFFFFQFFLYVLRLEWISFLVCLFVCFWYYYCPFEISPNRMYSRKEHASHSLWTSFTILF